MDGMIILFQGSRGSGKTLSMVAEYLDFKKQGWDILANFKTPLASYISDEEILALDKTSNLKDCVVLIDEMQIFFDSRLWNNKSSIKFSNFIQQIRKRNIVLMGTTQYVDTVEKRIRQHVDILIKPSYDEDLQVCSCMVYDLTSLEDDLNLVCYRYYYYAPPLFPLYDTAQLI
jgi:thymidine kinase